MDLNMSPEEISPTDEPEEDYEMPEYTEVFLCFYSPLEKGHELDEDTGHPKFHVSLDAENMDCNDLKPVKIAGRAGSSKQKLYGSMPSSVVSAWDTIANDESWHSTIEI